MKEIQQYLAQLAQVLKKHPEYKAEAYNFVMSALHHTLSSIKEQRHVTGQELCWGIKEYALEQFGPLARTVFEYWNVHRTIDFGNIVYNLIEAGLMSKTDEDSLNDFSEVYSFDAEFPASFDIDAFDEEKE